MGCTYNPSLKQQTINFTFFGHYKENNISAQIPTDLLETGKKLKLVMVCDPLKRVQNQVVGEWLMVEGITFENQIIPIEFKQEMTVKQDNRLSIRR